ncbi:hypothetical protein VVR12_01805 [Rothia sp. LK2588]|uniref:phage tail tube protein n=1 Tax=Rothia sp. LK2588 TaxID=3114369 RepID=UPI0034CD8DC5
MAVATTGTDAVLSAKPASGTGVVFSAPKGTTLPPDALETLNVAFLSNGYVGEDGIKRKVDKKIEKIKAYGDYTVASLVNGNEVSYEFEFLESGNGTTLKTIFGEENVSITPPEEGVHGGKVKITHNASLPPTSPFVMDMKSGKTRLREVVPVGQISVSGDVQFVHNDVIRYSVTIEALSDDKGNNAYSYQDVMV